MSLFDTYHNGSFVLGCPIHFGITRGTLYCPHKEFED